MSEFSRLLPPDHFLSVYESITVPNTYDSEDDGQTVSRKLAVITRNNQGAQDTSGSANFLFTQLFLTCASVVDSVLLVKEKPNVRAGGSPIDFVVLSVLPITSKFRIKTSQRAIRMANPSPSTRSGDDIIKGIVSSHF